MQSDPLSPDTQATIDRLIPPPWASWKRGIAGAIAAVVLLGFGWLWTGGWLAPNLEMAIAQWGGSGPVTVGIHLINNGSRSVSILSVGTSSGLELVAVTGSDQPLPFVLDPGSTTLVLATFEVTDCSLIDHADFAWPIEVEFADGPLRMRQSIDWDLRGFVFDERVGSANDSAWPAAMTEYVCP